MHLCWVIQPGTNSQMGYLSGLCATGAGNLFLLDHIIITHYWVFAVSSWSLVKGGLKFDSFPIFSPIFSILTLAVLFCECDNVLVLFFVSNLFLLVNLDRVTFGFFAVFLWSLAQFLSNYKRFEAQYSYPVFLPIFSLLPLAVTTYWCCFHE